MHHEMRRKTTKAIGVPPMVKALSKPSTSPTRSMAANNSLAKPNTGNNDAAVLSVTTTTASAGCVRLRGAGTKAVPSAPSSIPAPLPEKARLEDHKRPQCHFAWPVWVRVVAKTEVIALVIEVAYIVALKMEFPEAMVTVLLAALLTFITAIVVLFLATLTERSRAMLNTIILSQQKRRSLEAEQIFPHKSDFASLVPSGAGASCEWIAV
ncbi:uncharacterized protein LOC144123466 [Amblyomma americanum]